MLKTIVLSFLVGIGVALAVLLIGVIFGMFGLGSIATFCTWSAPIWGLVAGLWYGLTRS